MWYITYLRISRQGSIVAVRGLDYRKWGGGGFLTESAKHPSIVEASRLEHGRSMYIVGLSTIPGSR